MVHVTTGNKLNVVYDWEGKPPHQRKVLKGLQRWHSDELIPLPDPEGLIAVLQRVVDEVKADAAVSGTDPAGG